MIFKRWFKPKWQHQDAAVRQIAIAELQATTAEQKEILHELAFNDAAESVRRTALERLNEFSLWWQASKHEVSERLKAHAEQQLVQMLLENKVTNQLKKQFIQECHRSSILEKLALMDTDPGLKYELITRLARTDLYVVGIQNNQLEMNQRLALIHLLDDDKALEKLAKTLDGALQLAVKQKISDRLELKQKPERTRKQVVLLLAKLNSVRENADLGQAQIKLQQYMDEYQKLAADIAELTDATDFVEKYNKIIRLTEASFAPRLAAQAQLIQQQQFAQTQRNNAELIKEQLQALEQQFSEFVAASDLNAATALNDSLQKIQQQAATLSFTSDDQQLFQRQFVRLERQFAELPALAEGLAQVARLLAEQAAVALPSAEQDIAAEYQQFKQWQQQWRAKTKPLQPWLPQSFKDGYTQIVEQWQSHCEPLLAVQDKSVKQLKSKIAEFKRLYEAGKYNVLFGLAKGIDRDAQALAPAVQQTIRQELDGITQQVAELADLQAYIATPRKQELLLKMQQLAEERPTDPKQRADEVKQSRLLWQTLGRADASLEDTLNEAFNSACELAFAPCRDFFAQQDALRAENARAKLAIIENLEAAQSNQLKGKERDSLLQQSEKAWRAIGPIEKAQFEVLQPRYKVLVQALRQQQKLEQQASATTKTQLIELARQLTQEPSAETIAAQLKILQQQWKQAGFAGPKHDQVLWHEFRQICDGWFEQRQQSRAHAMQQQQEARNEINSLLATHQQQVADCTDPAELKQISQTVEQLMVVDDPQLKALQAQLLQQIKVKLENLKLQQQTHLYVQLFAALENTQCTAADIPAPFRASYAQPQEQLLTRAELTVALEWAAGVDSPAAEFGLRQQVQMKLLSDKHNSGVDITQEGLLARWLQLGAIAATELELLHRVKSIYLSPVK